MGTPVRSLDDFSAVYLDRLKSGDAGGLGELYVESAVLTTTGGPFGSSWVVGRDQIVAMIAEAMATYTVDDQTVPAAPFEYHGPDQAARVGTFESTMTVKATGERLTMTVSAFEVFGRTTDQGWQYLADHSTVTSITSNPAVGGSA
ncbi:YybH family protein [Nakamurella sp.]|uniref:YybH family protein n=1 Tax=Nakamurella sp. TaxID=1869182 RepID=UPI0037832A0B